MLSHVSRCERCDRPAVRSSSQSSSAVNHADQTSLLHHADMQLLTYNIVEMSCPPVHAAATCSCYSVLARGANSMTYNLIMVYWCCRLMLQDPNYRSDTELKAIRSFRNAAQQLLNNANQQVVWLVHCHAWLACGRGTLGKFICIGTQPLLS